MPAADLTFAFGRGVVRVHPGGQVRAVTARREGQSYLAGAGEVLVRMAGSDARWTPTQQVVDVDELELRGALGSTDLELTLRHTFATSWNVRLVLYNPTAAALAVEFVTLTWAPVVDCPARVLAAGADGTYAILPPEVRGPVLAGALTQGEVAAIGSEGITTGPLLLPPGGRYVVVWSWAWCATPALVDRHRRGSVPRRLALTTQESVRIADDPDAALVAPGLWLEGERGELELSSPEPGAFGVSVSAARGTSRYVLQVVPPLEDLLAESARQVMAGPRTSAGVVRLDNAAAGLVLQRRLAHSDVDDRDGAEDALDAFTAQLRERAVTDPVAAIYLCAESARTGDAALRQLATDAARRPDPQQPGQGLLVAQVNLARLIAGEPALRPTPRPTAAAAPAPVGAQAAAIALELAIFAGPAGGVGVEHDAATTTLLTDWTRIVVHSLGAGVTGVPLHPIPVQEQVYRSVVLGLLPEEVGRPLRRTLGGPLHQLAAWTLAEVSARLVGQPIGAAHAWLALASVPA